MIAMPSFRYGDKRYEYSVQLLHSRKKSISIHVLPDGTVEVKAPAHTSTKQIVDTMSKRARWVVRHVEQIQHNHAQALPREYISGETHFYLGRRYVLKVVQSDIEQVKLTRGRFVVECRDTSSEHVKRLLDGWYKEHARQAFERRLSMLVKEIDWLECPPPMTVRLMKKQWGSCSPLGRISLNWNLVKAPMDCIDYVITHELCHLQEHNHSKYFYVLMHRQLPGWKPTKAKLDEMAELLLNE